jgi:hypothetical protein
MRSRRCDQILELIDNVLEGLSDLPRNEHDVPRDRRLPELRHPGEHGDDRAPAAA